MKTYTLSILLGLALATAGVLLGGCGTGATMPAGGPARAGDGPSLGDGGAKVQITLFTDFQCPHSKRAMALAREVVEARGGEVRLVVRNHVLPYHPDAELAAVAALAADEQGRFWAYQAALFADQAHLDRDSLIERARRLGLDRAAFIAALDREDLHARVRRETSFARLLGVRGSPAVYVNTTRVPVPKSFEELDAALISAGAGAGKELARVE